MSFSTLITGATGFVGQHLARRVGKLDGEAWAGVFPEEPPERAQALPPGVRQVPLDVRDPESVARVVAHSRPEIVFHLVAAGVTEPAVDPQTALVTNTRGTIHLLEALRKRPIQRVVLVGTCHEYGSRDGPEGLDPSNFYAASKVAAWAFARAYWRAFDLPVVIARLFQVYGPGQPSRTLIPSAIRAALAGEDLAMTPGEQERDFVFVTDVADGLLTAATAPGIEGQSFDLGTGETRTIREVVEMIWSLTKAEGKILTGSLPYRPGAVMHLAADAQRTARLTGWRATTPLHQGLQKTLAHWTANWTGREKEA